MQEHVTGEKRNAYIYAHTQCIHACVCTYTKGLNQKNKMEE